MTIRPLVGALLLALGTQAQANIDIQFDYSLDDNSFFSDAGRKSVLESAASVFENRLSDTLTAISSAGSNSFNPSYFDPASTGSTLSNTADSFAANVIRVYVGGSNLGGSTLGVGGSGGFSCSGFGSFCSDAEQRGQGDVSDGDAVDVAPWGGSISFDSVGTSWHFGLTTTGLDGSESDFYSVAVHELGHLLGFGASYSFSNHIVGGNFVGTAVGTVTLNGTGHWANGVTGLYNGISQEAAMTASLTTGTRKYFTELDFAALQDIGWQVTAVPEADTWAMLLAGLGLVGFATRRRMA
jgi:hypothetical protein